MFFLLLHIIVGDGVLSQVWDGTLATCACATHVSSQRFDVNRIRKRCRISWVIMYKAVYHGLCMAQFLTGFAKGPLHSQLMVGTKASIPKARLLAVEESGRLSNNVD